MYYFFPCLGSSIDYTYGCFSLYLATMRLLIMILYITLRYNTFYIDSEKCFIHSKRSFTLQQSHNVRLLTFVSEAMTGAKNKKKTKKKTKKQKHKTKQKQ